MVNFSWWLQLIKQGKGNAPHFGMDRITKCQEEQDSHIQIFTVCLVVLFCLTGCVGKTLKHPVDFVDDKIPIIAVLPFKNLSNDKKLNWLSEGIAESITTEFAKDKRFKIVERSQIDKIFKELTFQQTEFVDPQTAHELGKILGCDFIITGSFQKLERRIKVDARRIESETGKVYEAISVTGSQDNIFALQGKLTKKLLESFEK